MPYEKLRAPLPYFGGKNLLHPLNGFITALLPPPDAEQLYIEPFAGMLSILLARPPAGGGEVANDLDSRVFRFWRAMRDAPEELCDKLASTPHSVRTYREANELLSDDEAAAKLTDVEVAWLVAVCLGQSFANLLPSATSSSGWSRQTPNSSEISRVRSVKWRACVERCFDPRLLHRLAHITLENRDAIELLAEYSADSRAVIYCDPPYAQGEYGYASRVSQADLMTAVADCEARIAISGYNTDSYDQLGWRRHDFSIFRQHLKKPVVECVWTSYDPGDEVPGTIRALFS